MPVAVLYLFKLSISLFIVWLFYQLLLRRLTFYNWNRWYLLGYSLLSFFIPLIHLRFLNETAASPGPPVLRYIPVVGRLGNNDVVSAGARHDWSRYDILLALIDAALIFFHVRFFII